ncbi:MAG: protein kinase [Pseudomonadota bacterium]
MDFVGKAVGRYQVNEYVGAGAMAHVYKAYDPDIDRSVALKVLKQEHCVEEEHTNRFIREGQAAGALTHPNIVTIHDVGRLDDSPYIMMEFLEGRPLNEMLQERSRLSVKETIKIVLQIADALDYAHKRGIVHRDVKPDNVVVDDQLGVKIADFGIARFSSTLSETTQAGMILGTPRYMSPEQAAGESVDGRSDLFSLGVILYEMLTGHKAFDAESMATLIMQIMQKDPPAIKRVVSDVPAGMQNIVAKLLAKNPKRRFQSGQELQDALRRELELLEEDEADRAQYVPLQVKWTAIMAGVVAIFMAVSAFFVVRAQSDALQQQAIDSGISLAKFTAVQTAIPVLGEDWITLETFVEDASSRETFLYLIVSDHEGQVRSASDSALINSPRGQWVETSLTGDGTVESSVVRQVDDVLVHSVSADDIEFFNINLPILFRDTKVGEIDVGITQAGLNEALSTTSNLLILLAVAMVVAVGVAVFVFNQLIARNLSLAKKAVVLLAQGSLETRISKQRNDEFGDLFNSINNFADQVQRSVESEGVEFQPGAIHGNPDATDVSGIEQVRIEDQTIVQKKES